MLQTVLEIVTIRALVYAPFIGFRHFRKCCCWRVFLLFYSQNQHSWYKKMKDTFTYMDGSSGGDDLMFVWSEDVPVVSFKSVSFILMAASWTFYITNCEYTLDNGYKMSIKILPLFLTFLSPLPRKKSNSRDVKNPRWPPPYFWKYRKLLLRLLSSFTHQKLDPFVNFDYGQCSAGAPMRIFSDITPPIVRFSTSGRQNALRRWILENFRKFILVISE